MSHGRLNFSKKDQKKIVVYGFVGKPRHQNPQDLLQRTLNIGGNRSESRSGEKHQVNSFPDGRWAHDELGGTEKQIPERLEQRIRESNTLDSHKFLEHDPLSSIVVTIVIRIKTNSSE